MCTGRERARMTGMSDKIGLDRGGRGDEESISVYNSLNSQRRRRSISTASIARTVYLILVVLVATCVGVQGDSESTGQSEDADAWAWDDQTTQEWYADDPYMQMIDDYVKSELEAEMANYTANQNATMDFMDLENEAEMFVADDDAQREEFIKQFAAGSATVVGFASAIYCTSLFLYYLKVYMLMRQYSQKGVLVNGRILASVPDIKETMKKCAHADKVKVQIRDDYSMMTDDFSSRSDFSGSDRSGGSEMEEGRHRGRGRHHSRHSGAPSEVRSRQASVTAPSRENGIFDAKSFRVIVEYDDVTYHDDINQSSSEIIRKRLLVLGEDIIESGGHSSKHHIKLSVLQKEPLSGLPSGEVSRALRWQKCLTFNLCMMITAALVVCGAFAAWLFGSPILLGVYIGIVVLQVPILNCCLQGSFSKIISDKYLVNGLRRPLTVSKKCSDDMEKMIAALKHGTSFGFD